MEIKENDLYTRQSVPKENISGQGLALRPDLEVILLFDGDKSMGSNYFRVWIQFQANGPVRPVLVDVLPDWFAATLLDEGTVSLRTLRRVYAEWDDFRRCAPSEEGMAALLTENTFVEFRRDEKKVKAHIRASFGDGQFTSTCEVPDYIINEICAAEAAEA